MFKYSQSSKDILAKVDSRLQRLFLEVIKHVDIKLVEGLRTIERQKVLVSTGKSKTMKSRHLTGSAIDWVPVKGAGITYDMSDCYYIAGIIRGIAYTMDIGVDIRMGSDWDGDNIVSDESFKDLVHTEVL